jgi:surfactin synthase thioesterase subunit
MTPRMFSKWVTCPRPRSDARARLFCLPFAGGGASAYRLWADSVPAWIEVCPVQLPGREDRYREARYTRVTDLSRALAQELSPYLDLPYAIFGHSMGALVGFELTHALRRAALPPPRALFLAAYPAPHANQGRAPIHQLPDDQFIAEMRRMQGTPEAVLQNADLMAFMLPVLRADFEACDTYVGADACAVPLDCPIVAYGGAEDHDIDAEALADWRQVTTGPFAVRMLPGTHFFVQSHRGPLIADITGRLTALLI